MKTRDWRRYVRRHLPPLGLAPEREAEIVEELAMQLDQDCRDGVAAGVSLQEATAHALARFPPWEALAAEIREAAQGREGGNGRAHPPPPPEPPAGRRGGPLARPVAGSLAGPLAEQLAGALAGLLHDVRCAFRSLRHGLGFTALAVAMLAFGIGVNVAVLTIVDAVERRSLPFAAAGQLMAIETRPVHEPEAEAWTSAADFFDLRERVRSFSRLAAISPVWNVVLTSGAGARRLECLFVSADFLPALGVRPVLGRGLLPADDDRRRPARVVLLSHAFWRQHFGAAASALGKTLELDGSPYVIAGVLPAGFRYPGEPLLGTAADVDVWLPLAGNPLIGVPQRSLRFLKVIARRRAGVAERAAREEVRQIGGQLAQEYPASDRGFALRAQPLAMLVKGRIRSPLLLLLGAVGFVLLLTCANVANLALARNAARQQELSVRIALGASGTRLLRQLLAEALALAALGGALGLGLAYGCLRALAAAAPPGLLPAGEISLGAASLLFTAAAALGCAVLAGALPGLQLRHLAVAPSLAAGARTLSAGNRRLRAALVAFEMAVALTLLVAAGLLVRSFVRLLAVDPGFTASHLVTLTTQTPPAARTPEQRSAVYRAIADRLAAVPGVRGVGAVSRLPLTGANIGSALTIEGSRAAAGETPEVEYRVATPSYFATMGIPLRSGRLFDARDEAAPGQVVLINQSAAKRYWPGQDPVGKRIKLGPDPERKRWITIVGVLGDVRHFGLDALPRPEAVVPFAYSPLSNPILVVRTAAGPAQPSPTLRSLSDAVRSATPGLPVYNVAPMQELVERSAAQRRFLMELLTAFAAAALLLAAVGVYGIAAQSVTQRTREIGLRMALGARPGAALRLILRDGLRSILPGLALGSAAAVALTRTLRSMLFEVSPLDPVAFAAAAAMLLGLGVFACLVPARRASRVDPLVALRHE
jgi:predicted permease